jgi:hypothetical protein
MRLARIGLALIGLSLAAPTAIWADPPVKSNAPRHKHKRNIFGREQLCPDCQRAKLRAQGIEVPPPPPFPTGVVMEGGACQTCEAGAMRVASGPMTAAPGYAVANGNAPDPNGAQFVSAEPTPIGVVQPRRSAAAGRPAGSARTDRALMQASMPAPDPLVSNHHEAPHILGHLTGLSAFRRDLRDSFEYWGNKKREKHASISYGPPSAQNVNDLPASVVYRQR